MRTKILQCILLQELPEVFVKMTMIIITIEGMVKIPG